MNDNGDIYDDGAGTAAIDNNNNAIYDDDGGCDNGKDGDEDDGDSPLMPIC